MRDHGCTYVLVIMVEDSIYEHSIHFQDNIISSNILFLSLGNYHSSGVCILTIQVPLSLIYNSIINNNLMNQYEPLIGHHVYMHTITHY